MADYKEDYIDLQDFFAGERVVKEKGERYTPRLEGQKGKNSLYQTYKNFGILFNALARTRQGLKGAVLRKPIDVQFPDSQKDVLDSIMLNGASFNDLAREVCDAILGFGRNGVLVDIDKEEHPYAVSYAPLSIIKYPEIKGKNVKQEILLQEIIKEKDDDDDEKEKEVEQRRKLEIDDRGYYLVTVYRKSEGVDGKWAPIESTKEEPNPKMPTYKGKRLDFIPFVFFGSSSNVPEPSKPPLLDLLYLLKGHWRLTVAYQYGLHFAGLPTPCFAGFDFEDGDAVGLGPGAAHFAQDPNAKSWFLQTGGAGLADMEKGLDRLEAQMSTVGARLLEGLRPGVESAETVKLRSSGDSATLSDIAGNIEAGLTDVLQYIGFWLGIPKKDAHVAVNKDFVSTRLSPQDIAVLLEALQAGRISEETFIWNLQQGEVLQDGRTIEDEIEAIGEDRLKNQQNAPNL
jgi:hypothetical protein